jgi:hypothetical protein
MHWRRAGHCDDRGEFAEIKPTTKVTKEHKEVVFEGETIREIRYAVAQGKLREPFRAPDVNRVLGIDWAGSFLPEHCIGNGYTTEHFVRVARGLYRLKKKNFVILRVLCG